jgi:hypothetical protein
MASEDRPAGIAIAAAAVVGMSLVNTRLATLVAVDVRLQRSIEDFLAWREVLHRLLVVQGVILGSAILAVAALRSAILAGSSFVFPQELVIGFGLAASASLPVVYAPVNVSLVHAGRRLRDAAFPLPAVDAPDWSERLDRRARFETLLGIDRSIGANFQASLGILTPLASSVVGVLLGIDA